jgi:hypothetical protein
MSGMFEDKMDKNAKRLSDLFWENELEWSKWLRMGVTEKQAIKLSPKYGEEWVKKDVAVDLHKKAIRDVSETITTVRECLHDCENERDEQKKAIEKLVLERDEAKLLCVNLASRLKKIEEKERG